MKDDCIKKERVFPRIDLALCDRCGICVIQCPEETLEMTPQGPQLAEPATCTFCTRCEVVCPRHAVRCAYAIVWR